MPSFVAIPHGAAVWPVLVLGTALLQGCAQKPVPQAPQPRLFASDFQGAAKTCTAAKPSLSSGKETAAAMTVGNDGGWCAVSVADDGRPFAAGLLTQPPAHGTVYIHPVGDTTRVDYTPDSGFAGDDAFAVRLLPGNPVLRVSVMVKR